MLKQSYGDRLMREVEGYKSFVVNCLSQSKNLLLFYEEDLTNIYNRLQEIHFDPKAPLEIRRGLAPCLLNKIHNLQNDIKTRIN